ncbi:hypothetical protein [Candidatus Synechococcus spongiarum]|uniref:hypothetical protein n=1 Tax=Candidatus Synechococcus spongiarum TaxID=431041 RepID=UPI001177507B|nr:hypothetical protein [Candidatus Synechococcus spongiarum]
MPSRPYKALPRNQQRLKQRFQRALFEELAGPWMGRDCPYLRIVNHLADGQGKASSRSFLAAIRQAAEDSLQRHDAYPLALHMPDLYRLGFRKGCPSAMNPQVSSD